MGENKSLVLWSEFQKAIIVFQSVGYHGNRIAVNEINKEVFPGIYMRITSVKGLKHLINHLKGIDDSFVEIINNNKRDKFEIIDHKDKKEDTQNQIGGVNVEMLHPEKVAFPNNLGGGKCHGCPVINEFAGLTDTGGYAIISDSEIVSQTKGIEYYDDLCKKTAENNANGCYATFEKILANGYSDTLPNGDMIQVTECDGVYIASEGKHRICAMKRNNYNKPVPMLVSHLGIMKKMGPIVVEYSPTEEMLGKYYKAFGSYRMNKEDVRSYLSSGQDLCKIIYAKK